MFFAGFLPGLSKSTVFAPRRDKSSIEHSRHGSVTGFTVNLMTGLAAYSSFPKKPMMDRDHAPPCRKGLIRLWLFSL